MLTPSEVPIFIVDDDPGIVGLVRHALELENFKNIESAESGMELLSKLNIAPLEVNNTKTVQQSSVYIFILDIMLPDVNGLDLCTQLKGSFPNSIVMVMSGFDIEDLHKRIIECDADEFLTKPFNPLEMTSRINLLIHKYNKHLVKSSVFAMASDGSAPRNQVPHIGDDIDEFNIIDCLGWGKSSVIYKVLARNGKDVYAIKLLTRYALEFEDVVKRFQHEIKIMAMVDHPNVIKFYKMGDYNGCPYILMDYIPGLNLEEFIVTRGIPDLKTIFLAAHQTAEAVNASHKFGILHRDIKLKNIIMDLTNLKIKLTDFGIARTLEEGLHITQDGFIIGTPIYMAPELFRGELSSFSSDIYSYGVTMYQFITGFPPFVGKSNADLYKKHLEAVPKTICETRPELPPDFDELLVRKCMAKSPSKRPASMLEVLKELDAINSKIKII